MSSSTQAFFAPLLARHSIYKLDKSSPISNERIQEIVAFAITNAPSAFNVQSARAVILLGAEHDKLWDYALEVLKASLPEAAYTAMSPKVLGFKAGYGSVLFFEDDEALDTLKSKNPGIQHVIPEWSDHSSGMHQIIVWAALENEGLGANLQHYNFNDDFTKKVRAEWNLPETWRLKSQLVFGKPLGGPDRERTYLPLEPRLKVYGA